MKNKQDINYYLNLPWTYTIEQAKDENNQKVFIVRVNELPGVCTDAHTIEEALALIKEAMLLAFEMYIENGEEIPEPVDESKFKGNIAYRTSSRRHYLIAREAQKRNESLSKIIDECIDSAISGKSN